MTSTEKTQINRRLRASGLDGNGRFRSTSEALATVGAVLGEFGFETEILSAFFFSQSSGEQSIALAGVESTALRFTWMERETTFEAVAYLG